MDRAYHAETIHTRDAIIKEKDFAINDGFLIYFDDADRGVWLNTNEVIKIDGVIVNNNTSNGKGKIWFI